MIAAAVLLSLPARLRRVRRNHVRCFALPAFAALPAFCPPRRRPADEPGRLCQAFRDQRSRDFADRRVRRLRPCRPRTAPRPSCASSRDWTAAREAAPSASARTSTSPTSSGPTIERLVVSRAREGIRQGATDLHWRVVRPRAPTPRTRTCCSVSFPTSTESAAGARTTATRTVVRVLDDEPGHVLVGYFSYEQGTEPAQRRLQGQHHDRRRARKWSGSSAPQHGLRPVGPAPRDGHARRQRRAACVLPAHPRIGDAADAEGPGRVIGTYGAWFDEGPATSATSTFPTTANRPSCTRWTSPRARA